MTTNDPTSFKALNNILNKEMETEASEIIGRFLCSNGGFKLAAELEQLMHTQSKAQNAIADVTGYSEEAVESCSGAVVPDVPDGQTATTPASLVTAITNAKNDLISNLDAAYMNSDLTEQQLQIMFHHTDAIVFIVEKLADWCEEMGDAANDIYADAWSRQKALIVDNADHISHPATRAVIDECVSALDGLVEDADADEEADETLPPITMDEMNELVSRHPYLKAAMLWSNGKVVFNADGEFIPNTKH